MRAGYQLAKALPAELIGAQHVTPMQQTAPTAYSRNAQPVPYFPARASMRASSSVDMSESYARWMAWNLTVASSALSWCLSGCHTCRAIHFSSVHLAQPTFSNQRSREAASPKNAWRDQVRIHTTIFFQHTEHSFFAVGARHKTLQGSTRGLALG